MRTYPRTHARTHRTWRAFIKKKKKKKKKRWSLAMFGEGRSSRSRRFPSISIARQRQGYSVGISLLPRQDFTLLARHAGHYLSTSYYSTRAILPHSLFFSLSRSLPLGSVGTIEMAVRAQLGKLNIFLRCTKQDTWRDRHETAVRSRFFSIIPSYCTRIIVSLFRTLLLIDENRVYQ